MWIAPFAIAMLCLVLSGCASQPAGGFVRADGRQDAAQMQLALAQCKAEGARGVQDYVDAGGVVPFVAGSINRSSKETTIVNGCMARNGYLAQ